MVNDYRDRSYLSVSEVSSYTGLPVQHIHALVKGGHLAAFKSASGQYRFRLSDLFDFRQQREYEETIGGRSSRVECKGTEQTIILGDSRDMGRTQGSSVHLIITSPPYFNAKMYSESLKDDLGNIHDLDKWLLEIGQVWREVYRVLQPGRKFFLNIMNLPVRNNGSFKSINLVGKNIDLCEEIGFVFKRDIVWHKTNGVRAHFGTYPYPGGILLNNMHESILEFEKPAPKSFRKYTHVNEQERELSKLDKDFWLSIKNSDVWLIQPEKSGRNRNHAAPFPLELPTRLIRAYSFVGETVLDPFIGSGTTLVASALHGRNGVGYDVNPDFCDLSERRLQEILV